MIDYKKVKYDIEDPYKSINGQKVNVGCCSSSISATYKDITVTSNREKSQWKNKEICNEILEFYFNEDKNE